MTEGGQGRKEKQEGRIPRKERSRKGRRPRKEGRKEAKNEGS